MTAALSLQQTKQPEGWKEVTKQNYLVTYLHHDWILTVTGALEPAFVQPLLQIQDASQALDAAWPGSPRRMLQREMIEDGVDSDQYGSSFFWNIASFQG